MYKILRLSAANIKKHKIETVSLVLLAMFCMLLITSAVTSEMSIAKIYSYTLESTKSKQNYLMIPHDMYDDHYVDILREDSRVTDTVHLDGLYSMNTGFVTDKGDVQALYMLFVTLDGEKKVASSPIDTTLTDEQIAGLEHPLYMPISAKDNIGREPGDTIEIVYGAKRYTFTIAGYIETVLFSEMAGGYKMVISDEDYMVLESLIARFDCIAFDTVDGKGEDVRNAFVERASEYSSKDLDLNVHATTSETLELMATQWTDIISLMMKVLSVIIGISAAVVIWSRITGDIKDRIVDIGVLEALGYTSREITMSYVVEYMLVSAVGCILGGIGSLFLSPAMFRLAEQMSGYRGRYEMHILPLFIIAFVICALITLCASIRADMVKKYPPVRAFRKGIQDHSFRSDVLPLRKTGRSVHLRLAMKGLLQDIGQGITIMVCVGISSIAVFVVMLLCKYFSNDISSLELICGMEMSEWHVALLDNADVNESIHEIEQMEGVRKVLATTEITEDYVKLPDINNESIFVITYKDYTQTENIFPCKGRYPEHDNEVMLTRLFATTHKIDTGDTIAIEMDRSRREYVVTGIVSALTNSGYNLYMTEDGMRALDPVWHPKGLDIYLDPGVNRMAFKDELTARYGRSITDVHKDSGEAQGTTEEERIRSLAEKQIAEYISMYGAVNVEWSVRSGDTVITGSSGSFILSSVQSWHDVLQTQLAGPVFAMRTASTVFMFIAAIVVMAIISIVMQQMIRKQYRDLGVMLSMGYTTHELMMQLALRIVPPVLLAVVIGIAGNFAAVRIANIFFGHMSSDILTVIGLSVIIVVFCFACAYIGARRIKEISVYELITE
ncbi:MAG: FtsX-like permease family protein [Oscillospiraceae bacterium]|nr:FtsX-like permease family protein [Oscillospiraceae bacterium]